MDLEQCYKELEGDYAEVMRRLRKEELVHRFLIKFLESDEGIMRKPLIWYIP